MTTGLWGAELLSYEERRYLREEISRRRMAKIASEKAHLMEVKSLYLEASKERRGIAIECKNGVWRKYCPDCGIGVQRDTKKGVTVALGIHRRDYCTGEEVGAGAALIRERWRKAKQAAT